MDKISEMPPALESVKKQLIREFPNASNEGLNTSRVEDFIRQEGLEIKPYIIFDRKDLPRVKEIVGGTEQFRSAFNNDEVGLYSPEMDMVLTVRDKDHEKSSGAIYTEGVLVHELAYASSMYQGYVTAEYKGVYTTRVGFGLPQNQTAWGWLLEEGWAEMHRAKYFAQNASEGEKQKLKDALKFGEIGMEDIMLLITTDDKTLPLPAKYLYITPEGKPTTRYSAYAGYALELLCRKNPAIKNLLIEGRSTVEGLRKLAQAFEEIMPGLYKYLQSSDDSEAEFSEKLSTIVTNVFGGMDGLVRAIAKSRGQKIALRLRSG